MKLFCLIIFLLATSKHVLAQHYTIGDTLNVVAIGGLKLREAPDLSSAVYSILKNGDRIVILEANQHRADRIEGFNGHWVKIISLDAGLTGFVFDAYISRYPVLRQFTSIQGYIEENWKDHDLYSFLPKMLEEYTLAVFKPEGCQVSYANGSEGEGNFSITILQLNLKATLIEHGASEGSGTELELSNPRISEVYYLIKNIVKFIPPEILKLDEEEIKSEREYGQVYVKDGEYPFIIRIAYKSDNRVSIIFFNACC